MIPPRYRVLTPKGLAAISDPCGRCGYGFAAGDDAHPVENVPVGPPEWTRAVADRWGLCGLAAHVNGDTPGYLTMAPSELVPFVSLPGPGGSSADVFSPDAAVVMAVAVCRDYRGRGLGRNLVRAAIAQLSKRQIGTVEAIGTYSALGIPHADGADASTMLLLPVGFWQALGFRVVRHHPITPTLRLDVSTTVRWRPDFAAAWHRLAGLVSQPSPPQPASFECHRELGVPEQVRGS